MKKPLNKFALGLWIVAAIYVAVQAWAMYDITQLCVAFPVRDGAACVRGAPWDGLGQIVLTVSVLASFAVLIELVDRIRWQLEQGIVPK